MAAGFSPPLLRSRDWCLQLKAVEITSLDPEWNHGPLTYTPIALLVSTQQKLSGRPKLNKLKKLPVC